MPPGSIFPCASSEKISPYGATTVLLSMLTAV
jgi:hypothetical protein